MAFLLYADKSPLSTAGKQKGYLIVARLLNLDCDIRNGNGFGGGMVVGWLPIVSSMYMIDVWLADEFEVSGRPWCRTGRKNDLR